MRWRAFSERVRTSLFVVPALWVSGFVVLSQVAILADRATSQDDLPRVLDTTVASARSLLAAVASGLNSLTEGQADDPGVRQAALERARSAGFRGGGGRPGAPSTRACGMDTRMRPVLIFFRTG